MPIICRELPRRSVRLTESVFAHRARLNRAYVASLQPENLVANFLLEAGLTQAILYAHGPAPSDSADDRHWGWESPTCQVRGQFLGHWLSAAAQIFAATGDAELKLRADGVVADLGRCAAKHGNGWCAAIPQQYFDWLGRGQPTWAPQYVIHKELMGLHDMFVFAQSEQALDLANGLAGWFFRWSQQFTREQFDNILDVETGGMLEVCADLYAVTQADMYLDLIERYTRRRLFDPLLDGQDPLTNMHANTTIPEAHGAARCYEVTGEQRWRDIAEAYWRCAVTDRGFFCTGGQTAGEIWTPPHAFAARLGDKNQEHCTVYNMIRLAEYLFRWSGEAQYLDYIERNLYNGILAQQHPQTGQISYFLPLQPGAYKRWGSPTRDFWCCHGSLVQAHSRHNALIAYEDDAGIIIAQYIPAQISLERGGAQVELNLTLDPQTHLAHRPTSWLVRLEVKCDQPVEFTLKLRLPEWVSGPATLTISGERVDARVLTRDGYALLTRVWQQDQVIFELPKALWTSPIPDEPGTVAFMEGPVVLAGLCDCQTPLIGSDPAALLAPDCEREWGYWLNGWRTVGQERTLRFKPLHEVVDEPYTVYFPMREKRES